MTHFRRNFVYMFMITKFADDCKYLYMVYKIFFNFSMSPKSAGSHGTESKVLAVSHVASSCSFRTNSSDNGAQI